MSLSIIGVEGGLSMPSFGGEFGRSGGSLEGHAFAGALGGAVLFFGAWLVPWLGGLKGTSLIYARVIQRLEFSKAEAHKTR